ncbi:hypothetical protein [Crenalkalicoccus roseus]|uniref:hypothetical protein n=1 Tax=Crenalkalicoccus roseus TaxID=1485588 RepID=UPI0010814849|nr:hypothetical protein [Crenalkalicoccus roseus]
MPSPRLPRLLALALLCAAGGAAGQEPPPAGARSAQQPTREATEARKREAGVELPPTERREQLRELNALSRELAPNLPVPAPEVAPERR